MKTTVDVDQLARHLMDWGRMARSMPPAWDGAKVAPLLASPYGDRMGRMLPGRGVYLDTDLKTLGITTRTLPGVYERSPVMRLAEKAGRFGLDERFAISCEDIARITRKGLQRYSVWPWFPAKFGRWPIRRFLTDQLGAITTYDGIVSARAGGKANDFAFTKASYTTVANVWSTNFRAGGLPNVGTYTNIPAGAVLDRTNAGALSLGLSNPTSGSKYLLTFGFVAGQQINMAILVDLLVAAGNIVATSNAAQTIDSTAITRNYTPDYGATPGPGVMMILDVTTAIGTTASNLTVNSYTDQDGNTGATSAAIAMTVSAIAQRLLPVQNSGFSIDLATGDFGVRSVERITLSAAMTAGIMALNLFFPLAFVPGVAANVYIERDSTSQIDALTELVQASGVIGCLTLYLLTNTTSTGVISGFMRTCAG